ncbi:MAG: hypothetical protein ACRCST_13760 [Turicibacter sp.]
MKTEFELINYINEAPQEVKIKGNRKNIFVSCGETEVKFPVVNHIYTRFICSLSDAEVVSTGTVDQLGEDGLKALANAAMNREASSFDLLFQ